MGSLFLCQIVIKRGGDAPPNPKPNVDNFICTGQLFFLLVGCFNM